MFDVITCAINSDYRSVMGKSQIKSYMQNLKSLTIKIAI